MILAVLFVYRTATTIPGVVIVLIGVPVYFLFKRQTHASDPHRTVSTMNRPEVPSSLFHSLERQGGAFVCIITASRF